MNRGRTTISKRDFPVPCEMDRCRQTSEYIIHSEGLVKNMGVYLCKDCLMEVVDAAAKEFDLVVRPKTYSDEIKEQRETRIAAGGTIRQPSLATKAKRKVKRKPAPKKPAPPAPASEPEQAGGETE